MIISPIRLTDKSNLYSLEYSSNPYPWSETSLLDGYHHYQNLAIYDQDRLIAFLYNQTILDQSELVHFVVAKAYQRQGIGSRLLAHWITLLKDKGIQSVFLEVRASNQAAISLYQKFGFKQIGLRKQYYQNKEDALLMSATI